MCELKNLLSAFTLRDMAIYNLDMAISVSKFKNSCLDVIRRVETTGQSVSITRRGKVVARLAPSFQATQSAETKPWQKLRALGGELLAEPSESVIREEDFEALRSSCFSTRTSGSGGLHQDHPSGPQNEMHSIRRRRPEVFS